MAEIERLTITLPSNMAAAIKGTVTSVFHSYRRTAMICLLLPHLLNPHK
jgi:hypothetical protein